MYPVSGRIFRFRLGPTVWATILGCVHHYISLLCQAQQNSLYEAQEGLPNWPTIYKFAEVVAALTVQGGLVKNKMKGGVYIRPPPLTCFFFYWNTMF